MNNTMGSMSFIAILISSLIAVYLSFSLQKGSRVIPKEITSFEECSAAGNPTTRSLPGTCRTPNGDIFIQELK